MAFLLTTPTYTINNISKSKSIQTFFGLIIRHVLRRFLLSVDQTACEASVTCDKFGAKNLMSYCIVGVLGTWLGYYLMYALRISAHPKMRPYQCRLEFGDLQETVLPDIKISADFDICTWQVRVIRLFNFRESFMVQIVLSKGPV